MTATIYEMDAALDYLAAELSGAPFYASTVAQAHGTERVARGMASLLLLMIGEAANETGKSPITLIETIRETYCPRDGS